MVLRRPCFEHARTELAFGEFLRRNRRRGASNRLRLVSPETIAAMQTVQFPDVSSSCQASPSNHADRPRTDEPQQVTAVH
ncbi:MAG TPA: hypothetical protein VFZ72_21275 [Jiangellaceae bacterium]